MRLGAQSGFGCGRWDARGGERLRWSAGKDGLGARGLEGAAAEVRGRQPLGAGSRGVACGGSKSLMSGPWLSSSRSRGAWRGDRGRLNLPGPACPGPSSAPRTTGGSGPEPSAHRAAPAGAELPAPRHAAPAVPPGVPALARTSGRQGPVAEHTGLPTPRPVARHPHLPAPCWRPLALHPGPLLRAQAHRTQARREPPGER